MRRCFVRLLLSIAIISCLSTSVMAAEPSPNWPRFGGPDGNFHANSDLLTEWDADNVLWKTVLGGTGQSSPVVWGNRIYLTSSESTSGGKITRSMICLNRLDGKIIWKKPVATGPGENVHKMNSYASASCATDGKCVVAYFGPAGLHCLDADGNKRWSLDLVKPTGPFGFGGSPIIVDNMVIQNCDAAGVSYIIAVDKQTGKQVWRTERKNSPKGGWSTPIVIDTGKRKELILNGEFGVQGYDPATGADYWHCQSFNGRGTPVPAWSNGLLITVNGKAGDIYAVTPGGSGNVTKTHMAWHTRRGGGRDLSSPVGVGEFCFVVNMGGVGTTYHASSGKEMLRIRLGGNFSATPLVANGLVYVIDETGSTFIIKPSDKTEILAKNGIGDISSEVFRASPTPSHGQLLLRSDKTLYCVGSRSTD